MSIVIIGGGVCGLSIGWFLARAGKEVTVCDAGRAGHGATWAAAGMLAAHVEAEPGEETLLPLLRDSLGRWPVFAAELREACGIDLGYRTEGTLVAARDRDDREHLQFYYDYHREMGLDLEWLSGKEIRAREPRLHGGVSAGVFSPGDHQVDNRRLAEALTVAFRRAGGVLRENCPVGGIEWDGEHVSGVRLRNGDGLLADQIVLAAGAWSRDIDGLPAAARPPVRPVKGQMLALGMDAEAPLIDHNIWYRDIYLTPRRDGRLLVGATVEEMGFDRTVTAGAVYYLLKRANEILPGVSELPLIETWAGLRPTSRDDAPILGPVANRGSGGNRGGGLTMATGHHRNGILLAPATAAYVSQYLLTGAVDPAIAPFTPQRFTPGRFAA